MILFSFPVHAQQGEVRRSLWGSPGIIDMPSARMAPDGQLWAGASFMPNTQHYNFGFQALPWLEVDFRYTGLQQFDPTYPVYYDRSFAAKLRLFEEGDYRPEVAIGVNDIIGTGVYSGEYIVLSKQLGAVDMSLGVGWGRMGTTALLKNPLASIFPSFENRSAFNLAGGAYLDTFFHGRDVGIFGGVTWQTPVEGLVLQAEYSSDRYTDETARGTFRPAGQINLGASYQFTNSLSGNIAWFYGKAVAASFTFAIDPVADPYPERMSPPLPQPNVRTEEQRSAAVERLLTASGRRPPPTRTVDAAAGWVDALWTNSAIQDVQISGRSLVVTLYRDDRADICRRMSAMSAAHAEIDQLVLRYGNTQTSCPIRPLLMPAARSQITTASTVSTQGLVTIDARPPARATPAQVERAIRAAITAQQLVPQAVSVSETEIIVYYANTRYYREADAARRLAIILMKEAPPEVEKFRLIPTLGGVPQREITLLRSIMEREARQSGDLHFDDPAITAPAPMSNPVLAASAAATYPNFSWQIFPQFGQQLFDPSGPLGVRFLTVFTGTVELFRGASVTARGEVNIWDNFNVSRPSDSLLPHVRTDFVKYFTQGKNGVENLEGAYRFRLGPNVFGLVRAGYLESMFAGGGGEILWRPEGQRWALGADIYQVWQRDYDRLFGLQPYKTTTAHVTLHYESPWYGLNFMVRAGKYLAGDTGGTFQVTRRFSSGVEIGAFFTKTNVSAAQFGEGSFDKGIIIRIPLGFTLPINSQTTMAIDLRPVQRDGGQVLQGDNILYYETRRSSYAEFHKMQSE